jgi:two-component system osmolarity sensor histidine kinase EnvZ
MARRTYTPAFVQRLLPSSLLGRSLLIIVTPLIVLQIVSTWAFYENHWDTVTRRLALSVAGDIATVVSLMGDAPDPSAYTRIFAIARESMRLGCEYVPGALLPDRPAASDDGLIHVKLVDELAQLVDHPFLVDTHSFQNQARVDIQLPGGVLQVTVPLSRLFSSTTYVFLLWMVGTSIGLFAIATIFMRDQVRPIRRLAAAADAFGKGRDVPNFRLQGAAEVRQAAAAFNTMRERIGRQIAQRTAMLAGVSHDLRTPLTRMKLQLAMLGDGPEVADLTSDVAEMEKMLGGYLAFARGEGGEQQVETNLSSLLRDVVNGALREGAVIDLHTEEEIIVPMRPDAFRRCLTNLITNARRYARTVSVRAGRREEAIEITIDDDGPGIPKGQREEVFKPFFRLDPSRNPETGGVGLGLTIARDIMRSHGGDLILADSPIGGLRARLRLPV